LQADKEQDKAELKTLLRRLERKDRAERIWHTGFYAFAAVLGSATALFLSTRGYTLGGSGGARPRERIHVPREPRERGELRRVCGERGEVDALGIPPV
jgi:hypothetical protein